MKIAVLNYSGSVGKTLVSHYLLAPRMPATHKFVAVETVNESAADLGADNVEHLQGRRFGDLIESIVVERDAVVDIGASNIESFLLAMSKFDDAAEEFDFYVVPTTPDRKAQRETSQTIDAISNIGVTADRILVLPNRIEDNAADETALIFQYIKKTKQATINPAIYLPEAPIFEWLAARRMAFETLLNEAVDATAPDFAKMYRRRKEAAPLHRHMDAVFTGLFGSSAVLH